MSRDSTSHTLKVVLGVSLVCSLLVAGAVVGLRQKQKTNQELDRLKSVLIAADKYTVDDEVFAVYRKYFRPRWVDLERGVVLTTEEVEQLQLKDFDLKALMNEPRWSRALQPAEDLAKILRQPRYMLIYQVVQDNRVSRIILPIYGKGLWSTMYGFIGLDRDLNTVTGLVFYEHGETPGLGGEIENLRWRQSWVGKRVYDQSGNLRLEVIKGIVDPTRPEAQYQVDGLSGATLTTRGVDQLVKFWLGNQGYGKLLANWRRSGIEE